MAGFSKQEFSDDTIARIAAAVRDYEQRRGGGVPHRRPAIDRPPMNDFLLGNITLSVDNGNSTTFTSGETAWNTTGETLANTTPQRALFHWPTSRYEFLPADGLARWIRFALPGALTTANATISSADVLEFWGGATPGSTVTLINYETATDDVHRWYGDENAVGIACLYLAGSPNQYLIVDMQCPPEA